MVPETICGEELKAYGLAVLLRPVALLNPMVGWSNG